MQSIQIAISEVWMSIIFIGILCLYKRDVIHSITTKYLLIGCICRLLSDSIAWAFDGFQGTFWVVLSRISNYLSFVLNDEVLVLFTIFLWYMVKKDDEKSDWFLRIYWIIASISMLIITLSAFFNWFYYFDENNLYHRGPYFKLVYTASIASFFAVLWILIRYNSRLSRNKKILGWLYLALMIGASLFEFFKFGLTLQTYVQCFAAMIAFFDGELEVRHNLNTTTKQLEKTKVAAEAASQAKTAFLNNMSHDIRTPMNAILGFTKLMKKDIDDKEKIKDYIQKIDDSGEYLLSIINNVLELARIESGKESVDNVFVSLAESNQSAAPLLNAEIANKKLDFTITSDVQHPYVFADMPKNKQITMNLISNAVKYTPEGGKIHLDFSEKPSEREGYAKFVTTVTDTGIGMSQEFLNHIFDAFSRERNTTECKINGTGLGMAIVKKLVDLMGGTIEVESKIGVGSKFTVTNYHKIVEHPELYLGKQSEPEIDVTILKGKRILLAEDNELNAEIATAILEGNNLIVEHAADGVICFDMVCKAEPHYYDLILMDIQMPNLNGYGATKKIRQIEDKAKAGVPIIAMTANAFEEDRSSAISAGMNAFVSKPIVIKELLETMIKTLNPVFNKK